MKILQPKKIILRNFNYKSGIAKSLTQRHTSKKYQVHIHRSKN